MGCVKIVSSTVCKGTKKRDLRVFTVFPNSRAKMFLGEEEQLGAHERYLTPPLTWWEREILDYFLVKVVFKTSEAFLT